MKELLDKAVKRWLEKADIVDLGLLLLMITLNSLLGFLLITLILDFIMRIL